MAVKGRAAGVLPINAAATKKDKPSTGNSKSSPRGQAPRLRLIIRRLPPGLSESEFWSALGEDWQVGKGKIDWAAFKDGKISKDPAKPSRPARGYVKVKDQSLLDELSVKVKQTSFQDARNTTRDPCLIGPPSLEFAPYNKIASGRSRNDGRQGTIDQDQEFIDFLQSLTEPITKPPANGTDNETSQDKVTTTPLVQYLKEKKANKAKEAAEKKSARAKQQDKDNKVSKQPKTEKIIVKSATSSPEKAKVAKASQEAVKAITKSVAQIQAKPVTTAAKAEGKVSTKESTATSASSTKRERQAISAAARIQRDLGLAPKAPRGPRATSAAVSTTSPTPAAKAEGKASEKTDAISEEKKVVQKTTASSNAATAAPPTGPRANRNAASNSNPQTASVAAAKAPAVSRAKASPLLSSGSKSAFLKHANPSQGVTEELLRAAFATFGNVIRCEIDKKKGLGYIDFEDAEALKKAMAASPVKVGEKGGQVVVLENRNMPKAAKTAAQKPSATATTTDRAKAAKETTPVNSPRPTPAAPAAAFDAPTPETKPTTRAANSPVSASQARDASQNKEGTDVAKTTEEPPTAPRNAAKGASGAGRGGSTASARGGRGGGGRGGGRSRGGGKSRGGAGASADSTSATANVSTAAVTTDAGVPSGKEGGSGDVK